MFHKKLIYLSVMIIFLFQSIGATSENKQTQGITYSAEQKYLFKIFQDRRSVRDFLPTPVPEYHIMKILDVARSAPTSGNQQPWKFMVISNRQKLNDLKEACISKSLARLEQYGNLTQEQFKNRESQIRAYYNRCLSAPVYIVVLVDKHSKYPAYNRHDGPLAAGYLMIAARSLGYGTVFFTDSIPHDVTMKILDIPDRFERICITPIGIPKEWPKIPPKKPLKDLVVKEKFILGENW